MTIMKSKNSENSENSGRYFVDNYRELFSTNYFTSREFFSATTSSKAQSAQ